MSILETKVSFFKTTKNVEVLGNFPISKALDFIREGKFKDQINKVRAGDKSVKTQLPTVAMHGVFSNERKKDQFVEASGLIILDIDDVDVEKLEEIKEEIMTDSDNEEDMESDGEGGAIVYRQSGARYYTAAQVRAYEERQINRSQRRNNRRR